MRQTIGEKKVAKYRRDTGLDVVSAKVRGGTGHRVDLFVRGGTIYHYYPKTGELGIAEDIRWIENLESHD